MYFSKTMLIFLYISINKNAIYIRIGSYATNINYYYFRVIFSKTSKQNCQNMPKDVFVKHALKLKFLSSNNGKPNKALSIWPGFDSIRSTRKH